VIPCISISMSLLHESEKNLVENSGLHGVVLHFHMMNLSVISAVGRESRDGKFPGIPGFLAFPFPGNSGPGSREKDPQE